MKTVHWQLPFAAVDRTKYRIDIYSDDNDNDNDNWPIQLTGGSEPFVTDGDKSDDFFASVRGQTGIIRIVDESGELMEELLPANNADRLVRLIRVSDEAVMWQGFLSCEEYSQSYVGRAHEISINVNSVLEAMKSVSFELSNSSSNLFMMVKLALASALDRMRDEAGVELFDRVFYPRDGWRIMNKIVNMSVFLSSDESSNGENVITEVHGDDIIEVVSSICSLMGWTARECGMDLYLLPPDMKSGDIVWWETMEMLRRYNNTWPHMTSVVSEQMMRDLNWKGADHIISINQGAKKVSVTCSLSKYNMQLSLPSVPEGDTTEYEVRNTQGSLYNTKINNNREAYSYMSFDTYHADLKLSTGEVRNQSGGTQPAAFDRLISTHGLSSTPMATPPSDFARYYATACLANMQMRDVQTGGFAATDGLLVSLLPGQYANPAFDHNAFGPVFRIDGDAPFSAGGGWLLLKAKAYTWWANRAYSQLLMDKSRGETKLWMQLKFGDRYWNGTQWVIQAVRFGVTFEDGVLAGNWEESMGVKKQDGLYIPIDGSFVGIVSLRIYADANDYNNSTQTVWSEMFFSELCIDYVNNEEEYGRTSNTYMQVLNAKFSEEVVKQNRIATDLHNILSSSLMWVSMDERLTKLEYYDESGNAYEKRPEIQVLERMATHYEKARRKIELIADYSSDMIFPLNRIRGYDNRLYAVLSESRHWREGVSTIRCYEVGDPS